MYRPLVIWTLLLGCANHNVVMTPTLDALAENGIRFDNYYSECPVCLSPPEEQ